MGYDAFAEVVAAYTPEAAQELAGGVPAADIERAAHLYGDAKHACIAWGLGVTEQRYGSECVQLICNLALATGKIGREGCALMPMRGQNNVQGPRTWARSETCSPTIGRSTDDDVAAKFDAASALWTGRSSRRR